MNNAKALKPTELKRLKNLRMLHGRAGRFGASTSKFLSEHLKERGVPLAKAELTNIYQAIKPIDDLLAKQIETAFRLPPGWMSVSHEFVFELDPSALAAHAQLATMPAVVRTRMYALIEAISTDD